MKTPKQKRKRFTLTNTSQWPNDFVLAVCHWATATLAKRFGEVELGTKVCSIPIRVKNTERGHHGSAKFGHKNFRAPDISAHCSRRSPLFYYVEKNGRRFAGYPFDLQYDPRKYSHIPATRVNSPVEVFVQLIVHEFVHVYDRVVQNKQKSASNEFRTVTITAEVLKQWRRDWPKVRAKLIDDRRRARAKATPTQRDAARPRL